MKCIRLEYMLKYAVELCRYHRYSNLLVHTICRSIRFEIRLKLLKMQKITNNETRNPIRHLMSLSHSQQVRIKQKLKN